ncbi:MAG: hypothetical protein KC680_01980 [Candidatus Peregrinibacteria bacterium]|nr:hypothetical protein [Candidatus Peregrinibacteria bacterium]MCB9808219.1 hypothetical protein [Candidatus Peribacteria bacterium]
MSIIVTAFYKFVPLAKENLEVIQKDLMACGVSLEMGGLTILGAEGINGTVAGSAKAIDAWKKKIEELAGEVVFKDSESDSQPFKRWFVKIRKEIVSLGKPDVLPNGKHHHIPPEEWDRMIDEEDVVILDTRNTYETDIGVFEGALDPRLQSFQEFPEWVANCEIPKEKNVLMYCTGGIRCEKACLEMERQGYQNVYQLDGGILRYMKERPEGKWQGECFVFDHRVAVGKDLKPSQLYHLCPHCGDPGDVKTSCKYCGEMARICKRCKSNPNRESCSKNCAHHLDRVLQKSAV